MCNITIIVGVNTVIIIIIFVCISARRMHVFCSSFGIPASQALFSFDKTS
jgi:hypothetical protein